VELTLETVTLPDGTLRRLGNNPPKAGLVRGFTSYPETKLIPEGQWRELIGNDTGPEDEFVQYTHDQDGIGQCNADATTGAMEAQRARQGLPPVKLSAADLYDRINGGSDNGSTLEDGLAESMNGVATAATAGFVWQRGRRYDDPAGERKKNRVLEVFLCPTFAHCFSAAFQGFDIVSGVMWYDNFKTDPDGWLPIRGTGRPGGHAIHGYKPTFRNGVYGIWHNQSWGVWGFHGTGRFVIPQTHYTQSIGGWWAVRSVVDEGGVVPPLAA
jgi:hypothetical protein